MQNRRVFIIASAVCANSIAFAQVQVKPAMVDPQDAKAKGLGYSTDSSKVDEKQYPKHTKAQTCANCALYQGAPKDASGKCPLFATKAVATTGWCMAWAQKP